MRYQNLPCTSEEYDNPDHDYVSTSEWASGSGSDTETEPNSLPVDVEGFSDIDSIAHTRTHHIHQWEEGHYSPILGYLDAALSLIASERAWYAVQRDRDVGQGWGRIGRRSRWRRGDGKNGQRLCLRRLPRKAARRTPCPRSISGRSAHTCATVASLTNIPRAPHGAASTPPPSLLNLRHTKATSPHA